MWVISVFIEGCSGVLWKQRRQAPGLGLGSSGTANWCRRSLREILENEYKLARWIEGRLGKGVSGRGNCKHQGPEVRKNLEDWGWPLIRWLKGRGVWGVTMGGRLGGPVHSVIQVIGSCPSWGVCLPK